MKSKEELDNYIGKKYNKWTVLSISEVRHNKGFLFLCECECGITKNVSKANLLNNKSKACRSCGVKKEIKNVEHRLYSIWKSMRSRCNNPNTDNYKYYGGRGIKICERWNDFLLFLEDMEDSFEEGLSLDRIDNDGNYSPDNCKWSTNIEQSKNTRRTLKLFFEGEYYTQSELSEKTGVNSSTIQRRRKSNYSPEEIVYGKNLKGKFKPYTILYENKEITLKELSILLEIPLSTLQSRKQNNYTNDEIINGKTKN